MQAAPKTADGAPMGLPALDEELDKLKGQLADLSSRYTERHPDVRKLKQQIVKTEKMRQQILAGLKTKDAAGAGDGAEAANSALQGGDPEQASRMAPIQSQLRS